MSDVQRNRRRQAGAKDDGETGRVLDAPFSNLRSMGMIATGRKQERIRISPIEPTLDDVDAALNEIDEVLDRWQNRLSTKGFAWAEHYVKARVNIYLAGDVIRRGKRHKFFAVFKGIAPHAGD